MALGRGVVQKVLTRWQQHLSALSAGLLHRAKLPEKAISAL